MWLRIALLICLIFLLLDTVALRAKKLPPIQRSNEYRIKKEILRRYDKTTRPVRYDNTTVEVNIAISLYHILDTNEKQQTFTTLLAIRQRWVDEYLTWDPQRYNGVNTIRIPADRIWTPDLVISNFAGDKFSDYMVTNTIVSSNGNVLWLYPALIKTYCTLNVQNFPFDQQNCIITFISWTHSGDQLDVQYNDSFANTVYYISTNQEWAVDSITAERHVKYYACCKEPYPDVTFTINMRRGSLFYVVNLIAPCLLIFFISFLGFFLPVESGEKVNLEITILLALVVFLLMVSEMMPPTPDAIPILVLMKKHGKDAVIVVTSKEQINEILINLHSLSGHSGIKKTIGKVKERYYWYGLNRDIEQFIKSCDTCQRYENIKTIAPTLNPIKVTGPWELCGMDLIGPLKSRNEYKYVFTIIDYYTKFVTLFPLVNKKAVGIVRSLNSFFCLYGAPNKLLSDQGTEFVNQLNNELLSKYGIKKTITSAYHPQTNGLCERMNATVKITSPSSLNMGNALYSRCDYQRSMSYYI